MTTGPLDQVKFDAQGLVPAVIQDFQSGEVLTLAYMNRESLLQTIESGETWFWSRSRQELWHKGETSGHTQKVMGVWYDCDADSLLVKVDQKGVACHTGSYSCFFSSLIERDSGAGSLGETMGRLARVIHQRNLERPPDSYTVKLLEGGIDRILKKVGEEAGEVIIAAKNDRPDEVSWEVADLLYHLLVMLEMEGVSLSRVADELQKRAGKQKQA